MTNEPKAGGGLDPEMLAAYIDKRLPPDERAAVEAKLAADPDSYELLVELIHAHEALKGETPADGEAAEPQGRTGAVVPMVPKAKRTGGWLIAGGVLAAAAMLVLAARLQPELIQRLRGGAAVDPQLAKLVAAVDEQRTVEARLTGGFPYRSFAGVARGAGDATSENLSLIAAAAEVQQRLRSDRSAEALHTWGVAQLLLGNVSAAIDALEEADEAAQSDPRVLNDLAAAYASQAQAVGSAEQWTKALAAAEEALQLDQTLTEAWFNRALAIEALFLRQGARQAWEDYLRVDSSSGWASEARTRLRDSPLSWEDQRRSLEESLGASSITSDLVARNPQLVREWVEEALLRNWAQKLLDGEAQESERLLVQARALAAQIVEVQHDAAILDSIESLEKHSSPTVASSCLHFLKGRQLYLDGAFAASGDEYRLALPALENANSPHALTCELYIALLPYFRGQLTAASSNLSGLASEFGRRSYPTIEGRQRWMLGIIAVGQGRYDDALAHYRSALQLLGRANESEGIAGVNSALSEVLRDLGDIDWIEHLRESTKYTPLVRVGRRHAILLNGTQGMLTMGYPRVALHYQRETLANARNGGSASMMSETFQWMQTILHRLNEPEAATLTLNLARQWIESIPDPGSRHRQSTELAGLEVEALLSTNPAGARQAAETAIASFQQEGRVRRLPQLFLLLARAQANDDQSGSALESIDQGLAVVDSQRVSVREARLRLSYFEEKWGLVEEGLRQRMRVAGSSPTEALSFVDRWRQPTLMRTGDRGLDLERFTAGLAQGAVVLYYAVLPDTTVIWAIDRAGATLFQSAHGKEQLDRLCERLRAQASLNDAEAAGLTLRMLSDALLTPVAAKLEGVRQVVVVPDGVIGEIPFAALFWPGAADQVIDHAEVMFVPSIRSAQSSPRPPRGARDVVLVGATPRAADTKLPLLAEAAAEVEAVTGVYQGEAEVMEFHGITVEQFEELSPRASVIHLASHASVNPLLPHLSKLHFQPTRAHPDGTMTAADVARLSLSARLVVLAGCETASGMPTRSEGVTGLASAFLSAGASSVLASMWPVEDRHTAAFQTYLHQQLSANLPVAAALRAAQLWSRAQPGVPSMAWASWVLTENSDSTY